MSGIRRKMNSERRKENRNPGKRRADDERERKGKNGKTIGQQGAERKEI